MRRFNTIIESANPPGINQLWIDKKKLRYFAEGKWQLLTGGGGSSEPPEISNHDTWIIDGVDTGKPSRGAKGDNGITPYINSSGNWQIGLIDTGVKAAGIDGQDGLTPYINTDKNWWIGTTNTGIKAEGKDGTNGKDGTDGKDGVSVGFGEPVATAESVSNNAPAEVTIETSGPDTAKVFTFHFKIPKGKDGSGGGGGTGVDGKTPKLQIGNVTTITAGGEATANVRYTTDDADGNPIYAVDFGIPRGNKGDQGNAGQDGTDGQNGQDGKTPIFSVGTVNTGAAGSNVIVTITADGVDANNNPKYKMNFTIPKGADGTNGVDGTTPEIGANGNWFINGTDTTKPSRGEKGEKGTDGTNGTDGISPTIGPNGNWMIGAVDTGVKALGEDGLPGKTPVFETGEVTTGAAGTAATVEVVINGVDEAGNPKYKINFTIPRGADGSGSGGSDRGRILFTLADLHESYRPEIGLSTILPAISGFALNDCVIDSTATVRQVTAVSEDKQTANLSDIIYSFPAGSGGGVTEQRVQEMIDASIGTINTALDNINGEVI